MAQGEVGVEAKLERDVANALLAVQVCNVATHSVQVQLSTENLSGMHKGYESNVKRYQLCFKLHPKPLNSLKWSMKAHHPEPPGSNPEHLLLFKFMVNFMLLNTEKIKKRKVTHKEYLLMELFSRSRRRLVSAQWSNNFGYCP